MSSGSFRTLITDAVDDGWVEKGWTGKKGQCTSLLQLNEPHPEHLPIVPYSIGSVLRSETSQLNYTVYDRFPLSCNAEVGHARPERNTCMWNGVSISIFLSLGCYL